MLFKNKKDAKLRTLSRHDLLELLIQQEQENEILRNRIEELEKQLGSRKIEIEKAGSIAEAALSLSGIFEAAEDAVAIYKENIRRYSGEPGKNVESIVKPAAAKAAEMIREAETERKNET